MSPFQVLMGFGNARYSDVVPRVAWSPGEPEQGFLKYKAQGRAVLDLFVSYGYLKFQNIGRP